MSRRAAKAGPYSDPLFESVADVVRAGGFGEEDQARQLEHDETNKRAKKKREPQPMKASELVADLSLPAGTNRFTLKELNAFADERHRALERVIQLENAVAEAITEIETGRTIRNLDLAARGLRKALGP